MAKKFLYVDTSGNLAAYTEAEAFEKNDFVTTSSGAADAGKPVILDDNGTFDGSLINASAIDHGALSGLNDDDHVIYVKADGTRDFSGVVKYAVHPSFDSDTQLVDKKYVDSVVSAHEWYDSCLSIELDSANITSPAVGDRYLINGVGVNDFAGHDYEIAEWDGSQWVFTVPTVGGRVGVDDEAANGVSYYLYGGSSWSAIMSESTTASNGLIKVGYDIQIDANSAGDGLSFNAGIYSVNVDNASIEITSDALNVKAGGITNDMLAGSISDDKLAEDYIKTSEVDGTTILWNGSALEVGVINDSNINFGTGLGQVNAEDIPILDGGDYTAETNVEGAIQELYDLSNNRGNFYTVDSNGVSKGDLCFISADNTVSKFGDITQAELCIGPAADTAAAGGQVKILANDTILKGVLSSATAGTVYYWDGNSLVDSIPFTVFGYVYRVGVAVNSTDLQVEVKLIKRNL